MRQASVTENLCLFGRDLLGELVDIARGRLPASSYSRPSQCWTRVSGAWQQRKQAWLALGIKSELGRCAPAFNGCSQWQPARRILPGGDGMQLKRNGFCAGLMLDSRASFRGAE
jgi:hypothetical protein